MHAGIECRLQDKIFNFFFSKILEIQIDIYHIWIQHAKCIQMSTNKPSIGSVVLEIVPAISEYNSKMSAFAHLNCSLHAT